MARVRVTDPYSGSTVVVDEDSPQAKAWGVPTPVEETEPKAEPKATRRGRAPKK